jgi:hypothetical protein
VHFLATRVMALPLRPEDAYVSCVIHHTKKAPRTWLQKPGNLSQRGLCASTNAPRGPPDSATTGQRREVRVLVRF